MAYDSGATPCSRMYFVTLRLSAHSRMVVSSISSTVVGLRTRMTVPALGFAPMAEPTRDDIDALVGPATPHFAYQLRARVRELIEDLPDDHPVRKYGEEKMELLDRLGHASSLARGQRAGAAHPDRLGDDPVVGARVRPAPQARMTFDGASVLVTGGSRGIGKAIALRFASLGASARRHRLHARRHAGRGDGVGAPRPRRRADPRARERRLDARRRRGRRARRARRARPRCRDGRDPAGARDRGQALGLDALRERPSAALADPRGRTVDAERLLDRRHLEPRLRARTRRTTRSSARRRLRSRRSSATSPWSSPRAGSA